MLRHVSNYSGSGTVVTIVSVVALAVVSAEQNGPANTPRCQVAGSLIQVPELSEGSGVAASKRSRGLLWAHNDSGEPVLIALDAKGRVQRRVRVPGAKVDDWEAIAVGPCPAGSCIYIGDIGDNGARRRDITIYRLAEPAEAAGSVDGADVLRARYPDEAHDAEALLVTPKGDLLIVTKGESGPVALYRLPADAGTGGTVTLQAVGRPRQSGTPKSDERITDGAVSPSGTWLALRTNTAILLYRTVDVMTGNWQTAGRVSLKELGEPQGEGITFGDETTLYLVGEGGGKSQPGTFARLMCAF
jgi:hypothetical protein